MKNLDSYKVGIDATIHEALKAINEGVGNIALVVDGDQKITRNGYRWGCAERTSFWD